MKGHDQKLPTEWQAREALRVKGQFWTPAWVAEAMVAYTLASDSDHLFDPAVGGGAFFRAAKPLAARSGRCVRLLGTEIDAAVLEAGCGDGLTPQDYTRVEIRDFVFSPAPRLYHSIVGNPPYIRHHRLSSEQKSFLKQFGVRVLGKALDGRAGLHVYFLIQALLSLEVGGRLAFIVPADICEGKYAPALWEWISRTYCLDAVITFTSEASPFPRVDTNALVFLIRNAPPKPQLQWVKVHTAWTEELRLWIEQGLPDASKQELHSLEIVERDLNEGLKTGFSRPPQLEAQDGAVLGDFVSIMRGVATGDNEFFFLTRAQAEELAIPPEFLKPAVGRTRDVTEDCLTHDSLDALDAVGRPTLLFAPDRRPLEEYPLAVQNYLQAGIEKGLPERALIQQRKPWYAMERRQIPPFLFAYLGRRNVRFIRNQAELVPLTGFLCVYPRQDSPEMRERLWKLLQSPQIVENLALVGKSYGQGAIKIEPRSLERLPISAALLETCGLITPRLLL